MSSLQDKMYNQEITPPSHSWERIAAALDDSENNNRFPSRLYNEEVNPPAGIWNNIADSLGGPEAQPAFPEKLYNIEITPPAGIWNKIVSALDPAASKVAPVRSLKPLLRYAAAAIFIGAVAYGVIRMTGGNDIPGDEVAVVMGSKNSNLPAMETPGAAKQPDRQTQEIDDRVLEQEKKTIASPDSKKSNRKAPSTLFASAATQEVVINPTLSQSIYAYTDHIPDISERYVMLMTPDGNIIRMAKKWSDLLCCVSGEEQDAGCKDQLKKWQEKLARSSLAPSPANFMDILSLVSSLDESNGL